MMPNDLTLKETNATIHRPLIYNTRPYDHQIEALRAAFGKPAFAYFLEQGTGKSKIIVDEIVNLIEIGEINCAIIIAPNNVHINWKSEFEKHWPNYNKWEIQIWQSTNNVKRIKDREETTKRIIASGKTLIFLINIEAIALTAGKEYLIRILRARRQSYLCIDESHKIKTPGAQRTKAAINLGWFAKYRRIATGTEAEEGMHNLYSQFRFLDQKIIGLRTYTAFRSMYCIMGGFENREIKGYQNQELLAGKIFPYVYNKRKKDCLDLPDKVYVTHRISMTKEQLRLYDALEEQLIIELKSGAIVEATQAMTMIMRLQQILCGHINNTEGAMEYVPSYRAKFVAEIVEEASSKVIVFCRFIKDVDIVVTELANNEIRAIGISSKTTEDRMGEIDRWRNDPGIKVLVITTATGGVGLTLTEATTTIFYSNSWSSTDRLQAEDRNHRIGTIDKVTYHDIIVPGTIDHRLLKVLQTKQHISQHFRTIVDIQRFLTEKIQ
jgi:SNF2 family DNA or RNA helicase